MSARERLRAVLAGSPEVRPGHAERLIRESEAELVRGVSTAIGGLSADLVLDPGRADSIALLREIAAVLDGGKGGSWFVSPAVVLERLAGLFESYGRAFLDGGIMTGFEAAQKIREYSAARYGKDTGLSSTIIAVVGESTRTAAACTVSGCGSLDSYLDTALKARAEWIQVRTGVPGPGRWYHSSRCAGAALVPDVQQLLAEPMAAAPATACARCGCTDEDACPGGCNWVPTTRMQDLCSACVRPDGSCTTPGCGISTEDLDESDPTVIGWLLLRVAGVDDPGRWVCSPWCLQDQVEIAASAYALADEAAEIADQRDASGVSDTDSGLGR